MASLNKLMKQAMRAQQQAEQVQAEMAERTVEATSGGGAVKVVARCDGSVHAMSFEVDLATHRRLGNIRDGSGPRHQQGLQR